MRVSGTKGRVRFEGITAESERTRGKCNMCEGRVIRSHRTGILHTRCYSCRYLVMIYGPNIVVRRVNE